MNQNCVSKREPPSTFSRPVKRSTLYGDQANVKKKQALPAPGTVAETADTMGGSGGECNYGKWTNETTINTVGITHLKLNLFHSV